jgi:hypothetical protein
VDRRAHQQPGKPTGPYGTGDSSGDGVPGGGLELEVASFRGSAQERTHATAKQLGSPLEGAAYGVGVHFAG